VAVGYVVKADAARELLPAMRAVASGHRFVSADYAVICFSVQGHRTSSAPRLTHLLGCSCRFHRCVYRRVGLNPCALHGLRKDRNRTFDHRIRSCMLIRPNPGLFAIVARSNLPGVRNGQLNFPLLPLRSTSNSLTPLCFTQLSSASCATRNRQREISCGSGGQWNRT